MTHLADQCMTLKEKLRLPTDPIGYKKFDTVDALEKIKGITMWKRDCMFCQVPFMARVGGLTVGLTRESNVGERCMRIHGLLPSDDAAKKQEAKMLSGTWMPNVEEGLNQQADYPRIPPGEAVVVGPVAKDNFDPDVILFYGNPAQIMMLMCGLQKVKYERFQFHFIGEGACVDSLGECYNTGKPALAIPCYGERAMGQTRDEEINIAMPPSEIDRAVEGLAILEKIGFKYPISNIGGFVDPGPVLAGYYPQKKK